MRRGFLAAAALVPSTLSAGGSYSEHDAHITCGPDVRVRHASGGMHAHTVIGDGFAIDARGGLGTTDITKVYAEPSSNEPASRRVVGGAQLGIGYDWERFGFALGAGYFGFADGVYTSSQRTSYTVLPTAAFRYGRGKPFSGEAGFGAPPIAGLARHWTLYNDFGFHTGDVSIGGGTYFVVFKDIDNRTGFYGRIGYDLTPRVRASAFLGLESTLSEEHRVGFATGGGVTFEL